MKKTWKNLERSTSIYIMCSLALFGCTTSKPYLSYETAKRIASPAWMIGRDIPAGSFSMTAFERIHKYNGTINVYIEGDGPTPKTPFALHLASKDKADNVIYIARPCQYETNTQDDKKCDPRFLGKDRYGQEVVTAYSDALDEIAKRYEAKGFNLIGYDGGALIAANLAADRKDVLTLRTVGGILDVPAQIAASNAQGNTPAILDDVLNPSSKGDKLSNIPQYHFIGGQDSVVPPSTLHKYVQSLPTQRCVQYEMIQEAEHKDGWVNIWPELLTRSITCHHNKTPENFNALDLVPATPLPVFTVRETPEKP